MPKYPDITVELVGQDSNAYNLLGICRRAMKRAHLPEPEIEAFTTEATSSDYNHLLITCTEWFEYALLLWPLHKGAKVDENDFIDVRWHENDDIVNFQEKKGKDAGDGIHTVGGTHLGGTSVCTGSFELLNGIYGLREKYSRHFHQLFGAVQKSYDFARQQNNSLGKAIYTLFDPTKPIRGIGWTIPILPSAQRTYFEIPEVKVVNPNHPLRIIHKQAIPLPQRIKIDPLTQLVKKTNLHE